MKTEYGIYMNRMGNEIHCVKPSGRAYVFRWNTREDLRQVAETADELWKDQTSEINLGDAGRIRGMALSAGA